MHVITYAISQYGQIQQEQMSRKLMETGLNRVRSNEFPFHSNDCK